jgi:hypothetical protein
MPRGGADLAPHSFQLLLLLLQRVHFSALFVAALVIPVR